ncbi:MAG: TIGR03960 family B12-binding radical SAM protein [Deltaproteobacteria bacterium]|nr:TIGR03960 family B12-binding radical SAM protein [Deltaproteobacteria bacterium]
MISILDQHWFSKISRPSRYLGGEVNCVVKDPAHTEVSIALAFPDVYEVGMSHLGLKILYHILNGQPWLAAERVFAPWVDLESELRSRMIPLAGLESHKPLSSFDIVGFSLQHELCYTNVLNMLDLSGIPVLASERDDAAPLIIAGGPACFNPEPVADFFDVMVIGDGEAAALEICRTVREANKRKTKSKKKLLSQLYHIKGVYVPSYFSVHYNPDGTVHNVEPLRPGYQYVEKAVLPDIDAFPYPDRQVVPFTEVVHDRLAIEIARGCTRGCRFCQAGMIYRPVRERSPESILEKVQKGLRLTGYEELSLLSLSTGDYSCIESLLKVLMDTQSKEKVAVSLPSLRMDSLSPLLIEQVKRVRKTGFTLAPEAGNDRMRRIINKGLTQEEILETARAIYGAGWKLIKLYFMIGLPLEEERDIEDIVGLSRKIMRFAGKDGRRARLNVSISTFVPKSHTPFMWEPQIPLEESHRKINLIREALKSGNVRVKWNQPELSWLEGIFSRGDRRLSMVLMEARRLGAKYDAWTEHFRIGTWEEAFINAGLDPSFYLYRKRSFDEVLPWDHIHSGVTKGYLKRERERAQTEKTTPDCREKCLECGVCDHKTVDPVLFRDGDLPHGPEKPSLKIAPERSSKHRISFTKTGHARFLGHLELARTFIRAFRRAGLSLVYSKGFHPMPKISFACALPVGTESIQETVDIEIAGTPGTTFKEGLNLQLPSGIAVTSVRELPFDKKKERLKESHFLVSLKNGVKLQDDYLETFLKSEYFPVVKFNKKGEHKINIRPLVKSMTLVSPNRIRLIIQHTSGPQSKPAEIVRSIFSLDDSSLSGMEILKTNQVLG